MQLTIESIKTNPSGKSCVVKAGGKDYFAKPNIGLAAGMTIDAETENSEYNGKTNVWIKKYKAVQTNGAAAPAPSHAPNGNGAPAWLPFASNTVAHAIQAGIITAPNMVEAWARAAKEAFAKISAE